MNKSSRILIKELKGNQLIFIWEIKSACYTDSNDELISFVTKDRKVIHSICSKRIKLNEETVLTVRFSAYTELGNGGISTFTFAFSKYTFVQLSVV